MTDKMVIVLLALLSLLPLALLLYQRMVFQRRLLGRLREITAKLKEILDQDSDERVMVFTDTRELKACAGQINRLLDKRQKTKAEFCRTENASRRMLSNISHDLKTPLTVIMGYLEIMRLHGPTEEMLGKVEHKAGQVMDMINQFFTLAKLEAGDGNLELGNVNVSEICREAVLSFYELLSEKRVEVDISIPEEDIFVYGDKDALNRILYNLLSNAVRYGLDGNYIGLRLRTDSYYVYINVTDRGKGIEKAFASDIFERLYTLEDSRNREVQGNGLGLTIARGLAEQMGGELTLESKPGQETVFTLRLKRPEKDGEAFLRAERNL